MDTTIDNLKNDTTDHGNGNKVLDGPKGIELRSKNKVLRQIRILQALITVFQDNQVATKTELEIIEEELKKLEDRQAKYEAEVGDNEDLDLIDECFKLRIEAGKVLLKFRKNPGDKQQREVVFAVASQAYPPPFQTSVQRQNFVKEKVEQTWFNITIVLIVVMSAVALISYFFMIVNHHSDDKKLASN